MSANVIKCHQPSHIIKGHQILMSSKVIKGNQRSLVAITRHRMSSRATKSHQKSKNGHQWSQMFIKGQEMSVIKIHTVQ